MTGVLILLGAWEIGALIINDSSILPSVQNTFSTLVHYLNRPYPAASDPLWKDIVVSGRRILIGFVLAAAINSSGAIPAAAHAPLQQTSVFLVAVALSAIGLSTDVAALRKAGHRPLLLGALLWITVAAASLALQYLTGTL